MNNKVVIITGATSGIGLATAHQLAQQGFELIIMGRNADKLSQVAADLKNKVQGLTIHPIQFDLSDLKSVNCAASRILMTFHKIDVLINNAGGFFQKFHHSANGFEQTVGVNHLGHFLLTMKLLPLLIESSARIVNVSSEAHRMAQPNIDDLNYENGYNALKAYADAKLYNILFTKELVDRYQQDGIKSYCLHPGVVGSNFAQSGSGWFNWLFKLGRPFMLTPAKGAETSVFLATQEIPDTENGHYFVKKKSKQPSKLAENKELRVQLWEKSLQLVQPFMEKRSHSDCNISE